jgi:UDP-glucose 4-epimerase
MSLNDLIDKIEEALHIKAIRRYTEGRPFDVQKNILDNTLARLELGWEPQTTFEQGVIKTAEWLKTLLHIK